MLSATRLCGVSQLGVGKESNIHERISAQVPSLRPSQLNNRSQLHSWSKHHCAVTLTFQPAARHIARAQAMYSEQSQEESGPVQAVEAQQKKPLPPGKLFRFWHDEKRFKGTGEDSLAQIALLSIGGARVGGHVKSAPTQGPLGWERMDEWDVLWSPSSTAQKAAAQGLREGQLVSGVPGSGCLTKKRKLTQTLEKSYGNDAWSMTPRTFELPAQMKAWLEFLKREQAERLEREGRIVIEMEDFDDRYNDPDDDAVGPKLYMVYNQETGDWDHIGEDGLISSSGSTGGQPGQLEASATSVGAAGAQHSSKGDQDQGTASASTSASQPGTVPPHTPSGAAAVGDTPLPKRRGTGSKQSRAKQKVQASAARQQGKEDQVGAPAVQQGAGDPNQQQPSGSQAGPQQQQQHTGPQSQGPGAQSEPRFWILKTAQHLGKGVSIVPQREAIKAVLQRQQAVMAASSEGRKTVRPFVVAQRYLTNPLLINGRKFGLRVWVVLTSVDPMRAYLHTNGLVLFSSTAYRSDSMSDLQAHLTNYAQNLNGEVWPLTQLAQHLGPDTWAKVWGRLCEITALTFAAGASEMMWPARAVTKISAPGSSTFELYGLDFLIDSSYSPWLLEVNSTPSMAVEHDNEQVRQMIHEQKSGMMRDLWSLLRVPSRYSPPTSEYQLQEEQMADDIRAAVPEAFYDAQVLDALLATERELFNRGGFLPLMAVAPTVHQARAQKWKYCAHPLDDHVRRYTATRV